MTHTKKPGKQRRHNRARSYQEAPISSMAKAEVNDDKNYPSHADLTEWMLAARKARKKVLNKKYREKVKAQKVAAQLAEQPQLDLQIVTPEKAVTTKAKRNITGIKIEKGIPIPGDQKAYPFDRMKVGDSIFIKHPTSVSGKRVGRTAGNAASNYSRSHEGKFTTRTVRGGTRIWRAE